MPAPPRPALRAHRILRQSWAAGALHHAHLLTGDVVAAHTLALAFAMDCNCQQSQAAGAGVLPEACGVCSACERIANGTHPDVHLVAGEGAAGLVPIETIRALSASLAMPPHEGRLRLFIFPDASALHGAAANALLKTLEEPPARTAFALCARSQDSVMPTIRSRCQRHIVDASTASATAAAALTAPTDLASQLTRALQERGILAVSEFAAAHAGERGAERPAAVALIENMLQAASLEARQALASHQAGRAQGWAACGALMLAAQRAIATHNAAPALTIESLLLQMRATGDQHDGFYASQL